MHFVNRLLSYIGIYLYHSKEESSKGVNNMKVTGLNELAKIVEYNNIVDTHIKKANKVIKKTRKQELIVEGVDPEIAEVMASVGL